MKKRNQIKIPNIDGVNFNKKGISSAEKSKKDSASEEGRPVSEVDRNQDEADVSSSHEYIFPSSTTKLKKGKNKSKAKKAKSSSAKVIKIKLGFRRTRN